MSSIYFCIFCPQKFRKNESKIQLKKHLIKKHLSEESDDSSIAEWIDWLLKYETELNQCLNSMPQTLPEKNVKKLLIGCKLCDIIIDCFKLKIETKNKKKDLCICGKGREDPQIVAYCSGCAHMFHYDCVEPNPFSGSQELSLYKCINCKPKAFEISELKFESIGMQRIHCHSHLCYEPFVCQFSNSNNSQIKCNERFFSPNFLETHMKGEHNLIIDSLTPSQMKKLYKCEEIFNIKRLIESSVKKNFPQNDSFKEKCIQINGVEPVVQSKPKTALNDSDKRNDEVHDNLMPAKVQKFMTSSSKQSPKSPEVVQKVKRPVGRPRKTKAVPQSPKANQSNSSISSGRSVGRPRKIKSVSQSQNPNQSNSSLSSSRSPISTRQSQRQTISNREEDVESDASSQWNSDVEQFEAGKESMIKNLDLIKQHVVREQNQNKRPNDEIETPNKSQCLEKRSSTELNISEKRTQTKRNVSGTETIRSQVQSDQLMDDLPLNPQEDESPLDKSSVEANHSSTVRLPHIQIPQNLNQDNLSRTTNEPISSPRIANQNVTNDLEPIYSDWLTHTVPKKYPYFPQINDEVVYIPYGHKLYIEEVRAKKLYKQTNTNNFINSDDKVFAKVVGIQYCVLSKVRLVKLTLQVIDSVMNIQTKTQFTVRFHDIDNVIDFIILRQIYDSSLMTNWKMCDEFRAIVEDKWWFGTIREFNFNEKCLKSMFQAFQIQWANEDTELLSHWDIEKITDKAVVPRNRRDSVEVNDEERQTFYTSEAHEWPVCGKAEECKRIAEGLAQIMKFKESEKFLSSVNLFENPSYGEKIGYPLNLTIVKKRVENHFYRRHAAIKFDIKFIESNARDVNPENSDIVRSARIVTAVCLKFIDKHKCVNPLPIYNELIKADDSVLKKIKYYSSTRPYLNPTDRVPPINVTNKMLEILNSNYNRPSTSGTQLNLTQPEVITLSDDEEEDTTQEQNVDTSSRTSQNRESIESTESQVETSDPVLSESSLEPTSPSIPDFHRFICIFCDQKLKEKVEAIDHLAEHLNCKLKCKFCAQNMSFRSLTEFLAHNESHVKIIKQSFDTILYDKSKTWIERFINFNETLTTESLIRKNVSKYFGDCCPVCIELNTLTTNGSENLTEKSVFESNRQAVNVSYLENALKSHLLKHLSYDPKYECTLCRLTSIEPIFCCKQIDENARSHLIHVHKQDFDSIENFDNIGIFYDNSKTVIPILDQLILDVVQNFLIDIL